VIGAAAAAVRHELVGLGGVVERNWYLVKRYVWWEVAFFLWTCANTLTIVFIAKGVGASPTVQNELATKLLIGGVIWAYLGIIFEILTETVSWERWEGTIEYTRRFHGPSICSVWGCSPSPTALCARASSSR
jgi:ABC-2 type transport system permease protein